MAQRLVNLALKELSFVDNPANQGSRVVLFKRADPEAARTKHVALLAKAFYASSPSSTDDKTGAKSFDALLADQEENRRRSEVDQRMWPLYDALRCSVTSIIEDDTVDGVDAKLSAIRTSLEQFFAAASQTVPEAEMELEKLLKTNPAAAAVLAGQAGSSHQMNKENIMSGPTQQEMDGLKAQVVDLTKQLATAKEMSEEDKKRLAALQAGKDAAEAETAKMKANIEKAQTDEIIKITEVDPADPTKTITKSIRKSEVGDGAFALAKSMQAQIDKANNDRQMVELEKRAETELGALPGSAVEKAAVLKGISGLSTEASATLTKMLSAGNAAIKKGMDTLGSTNGRAASGSAQQDLDTMVNKHATEKSITVAKAYDAVLSTPEGKALYRQTLDEQKAA